MKTDNADLNRRAIALFNFVSMQQKNDKRIGDLTLGDFVEICKFLDTLDTIEFLAAKAFPRPANQNCPKTRNDCVNDNQ
jgi:hypothetical protein